MREPVVTEEKTPSSVGGATFAPVTPSRDRPLAAILPVVVLGAILAAALLGTFGGGKSQPLRAESPAVALTVATPRTLRSGLFFETRIEVVARRDIRDVVIAVSPELWRDQTINTMIPSPEKEAADDGAFGFHFGPLAAGRSLTIKFDGQLNPPLFAGTRGTIAVRDGDTQLTAVPLHYRVWP